MGTTAEIWHSQGKPWLTELPRQQFNAAGVVAAPLDTPQHLRGLSWRILVSSYRP